MTTAPLIPPELLAQLRGDLVPLFVAAITLTVGTASIALAAARRPRDRALLSFGVTAELYGVRLLLSLRTAGALFGIAAVPRQLAIEAIGYCILVPFLDFLSRLAPARWRTALRRLVAVDLACAVAGLGWLAWRPAAVAQNVFFSWLALLNVGMVLLALLRPGEPPSWELRRLRTAFRIVAFFVLCENLRGFGIIAWPEFAEGLGLLVFVGGLGSIVARQFFAGRSRLAALRQELDTARLIQSSWLPAELPRLPGLDVAVRYVPAAEVAGDLYDFLPTAGNGLGVLVADVSGHGVPAALVASMIKIVAVRRALRRRPAAGVPGRPRPPLRRRPGRRPARPARDLVATAPVRRLTGRGRAGLRGRPHAGRHRRPRGMIPRTGRPPGEMGSAQPTAASRGRASPRPRSDSASSSAARSASRSAAAS